MRLTRRLAVLVGAALLFLGIAAVPALAYPGGPDQWCNSSSQGECLNEWFGGPLIKSYPGTGLSNEQFVLNQGGGGPCAGTETTANCPWSGTPAGLPIVQIEDANSGTNCAGLILGDNNNSSTDAKVACIGNGGWGTNWIVVGTGDGDGCPSSAPWLLINIHWTHGWGSSVRGMSLPSTNGQQVYANAIPACFEAQ